MTRSEHAENILQIIILLVVGIMAGAASFTHVHDWTMANSPEGTGDWFGWANAVISELTPAAAGLEIRRRKRHGQHLGYPMAVLIAAAALSIAAQLAVAKPGLTGGLLAAVPALAFLALTKLVLSRTHPHPTGVTPPAATAYPVTDRAALDQHHPAALDTPPAESIPTQLWTSARMAAHHHHTTTGHPITADALADHLGITQAQAETLIGGLGTPHGGAPMTPAPAHGGSALALTPGRTSPRPGAGANTEPPTFYLGTHLPGWLNTTTVPLFISDRRLRTYKQLPRANTCWALDSGGFQELKDNGRWTITPTQYIANVWRYRDHIGHLDWAAPMDWMCEPAVIHGGILGGQRFVGTGLSVRDHQRRTVDNYLTLTHLAPDLPFIPVLQGYTLADYLTCVQDYYDAGIDLTTLPRVGLGSVCRRQSTTEIHHIVATLAQLGLRLHGFGVKTLGLDRYGHLLASADSMAWSFEARRLQHPLPGCTGHKNCANCPRYAYQWYHRITRTLTTSRIEQLALTTTRITPPRRAAKPPTRPPIFAAETALHRAGDGYFEWLDYVWPAAGCTHPVRLFGEMTTVDTSTGEILRAISTTTMPDGVIYKACGNRRSSVCPSCADTYRRDAYHLIRCGLTGGKTIPTSVTSHPAVFATLTAPSFGPVHTRHVRRHNCTRDGLTLKGQTPCSCRSEPCHARRDAPTCPHGRPIACHARHRPGDSHLGQPLCPDCYDHDHHVIWNNQAGELWRRTKQAITRYLNQLARRRGLPPVRVSHGKVAEFQARGAVHFHALLRLDGTTSADPHAITPPPPGITVADLDDAVRYAATHIGYRTDPHPARPDGWPITWGEQVDVRIITLTGESVSDAMVAGYLAKYATKGTEITGHTSRRLHDTTIGLYADPAGTHTERLIWAAWTLGDHPDHASLRRWAHMLGFGGHFLTKARRYSVTFSALRAARVYYRRTQTTGPDHDPERFHRQDDLDDETTLVIGRLSYVGTGWKTTGDALLANTAADQARRRRETAHEELAHQHASADPQSTAA